MTICNRLDFKLFERTQMARKKLRVFEVARYILHAIGGEISTMKLQKLCYYCQAWHLAWRGKPLFPEKFEARTNGPVCRKLFELHMGHFSLCEEALCNETMPHPPPALEDISEKKKGHIDKILEYYGEYNGAQLNEMAHNERPQRETKRDFVIPPELMREYYGAIAEPQKAIAAYEEIIAAEWASRETSG